MARNRKSAKQAGARFERLVSDHLRDNLDDRIDRRVKTGAKDCGDIANLRTPNNNRLVAEAKDYGGRLQPAQWAKEMETERANDNALAGVIIAKRRGTTNPGDQWVLTTLDNLINILKDPK